MVSREILERARWWPHETAFRARRASPRNGTRPEAFWWLVY